MLPTDENIEEAVMVRRVPADHRQRVIERAKDYRDRNHHPAKTVGEAVSWAIQDLRHEWNQE